MSFILRHKFTLLGLTIGALAGYLYYANVGCSSGTCAITSKPLNSTLYGALMGVLFVHSFKSKPTVSDRAKSDLQGEVATQESLGQPRGEAQ